VVGGSFPNGSVGILAWNTDGATAWPVERRWTHILTGPTAAAALGIQLDAGANFGAALAALPGAAPDAPFQLLVSAPRATSINTTALLVASLPAIPAAGHSNTCPGGLATLPHAGRSAPLKGMCPHLPLAPVPPINVTSLGDLSVVGLDPFGGAGGVLGGGNFGTVMADAGTDPQFGTGMAVLGDLDGDGFPEVLASPLEAARVFIHFLDAQGRFKAVRVILAEDTVSSDGTLRHVNSWGSVAVGIGDLDGNGFPDVAIGDPFQSAVTVLLLGEGGVPATADTRNAAHSTSWLILKSQESCSMGPNIMFGSSLAAVSVPEISTEYPLLLLIGATGYSNNDGAVTMEQLDGDLGKRGSCSETGARWAGPGSNGSRLGSSIAVLGGWGASTVHVAVGSTPAGQLTGSIALCSLGFTSLGAAVWQTLPSVLTAEAARDAIPDPAARLGNDDDIEIGQSITALSQESRSRFTSLAVGTYRANAGRGAVLLLEADLYAQTLTYSGLISAAESRGFSPEQSVNTSFSAYMVGLGGSVGDPRSLSLMVGEPTAGVSPAVGRSWMLHTTVAAPAVPLGGARCPPSLALLRFTGSSIATAALCPETGYSIAATRQVPLRLNISAAGTIADFGPAAVGGSTALLGTLPQPLQSYFTALTSRAPTQWLVATSVSTGDVLLVSLGSHPDAVPVPVGRFPLAAALSPLLASPVFGNMTLGTAGDVNMDGSGDLFVGLPLSQCQSCAAATGVVFLVTLNTDLHSSGSLQSSVVHATPLHEGAHGLSVPAGAAMGTAIALINSNAGSSITVAWTVRQPEGVFDFVQLARLELDAPHPSQAPSTGVTIKSATLTTIGVSNVFIPLPDIDMKGFGAALCGVGDVNLDGHGDLAALQPSKNPSNDGQVVMFMLRSDLTVQETVRISPDASVWLPQVGVLPPGGFLNQGLSGVSLAFGGRVAGTPGHIVLYVGTARGGHVGSQQRGRVWRLETDSLARTVHVSAFGSTAGGINDPRSAEEGFGESLLVFGSVPGSLISGPTSDLFGDRVLQTLLVGVPGAAISGAGTTSGELWRVDSPMPMAAVLEQAAGCPPALQLVHGWGGEANGLQGVCSGLHVFHPEHSSLSPPLFVAPDMSNPLIRDVYPVDRGLFRPGRELHSVGDLNGDGLLDVSVNMQPAGAAALQFWSFAPDSRTPVLRWNIPFETLAPMFGKSASDLSGADLGRAACAFGTLPSGLQAALFGARTSAVFDSSGVPMADAGDVWTVTFSPSGEAVVAAAAWWDDPGVVMSVQPTASVRCGFAVGTVGDINQDGTPDAIVGCPVNVASPQVGHLVVALLTPLGTPLAVRPLFALDVGNPALVLGTDMFGTSIAPLGDLDGDGRLEVAVGAHGLTGNGGVLLISLARSGAVLDATPLLAADLVRSAHNTQGVLPSGVPCGVGVAALWTAPSTSPGAPAARLVVSCVNGAGRNPTLLDSLITASGSVLHVTLHMPRTRGPTFSSTQGLLPLPWAHPAQWALLAGAPLDDDPAAPHTGSILHLLTEHASSGQFSPRSAPSSLCPPHVAVLGGVSPLFSQLRCPNLTPLRATPDTLHIRKVSQLGPGHSGLPADVWGVDSPLMGGSVAPLGDVNLDGILDFAVGSAPGAGNVGPVFGTVFVLYMGTGGKVLQAVDLRASPQPVFTAAVSSSESGFGVAVVALGDVDGDELPDIAVGHVNAAYEGAVFLFGLNVAGVSVVHKISSGTVPALSAAAGDMFGLSLAALGDTNGDGIVDLAVGSPAANSSTGLVWTMRLHLSANTPTLAQSGYTHFLGNGAPHVPSDLLFSDSLFGSSLAPLGNWDGIGAPDLAIGAPATNNETGKVFLASLNRLGQLAGPMLELSVSPAVQFPFPHPLWAVEGFGESIAVLPAAHTGGITLIARARSLRLNLIDAVAQPGLVVLSTDAAANLVSLQPLLAGHPGLPSELSSADFEAASLAAIGTLHGENEFTVALGTPTFGGCQEGAGGVWLLRTSAQGAAGRILACPTALATLPTAGRDVALAATCGISLSDQALTAFQRADSIGLDQLPDAALLDQRTAAFSTRQLGAGIVPLGGAFSAPPGTVHIAVGVRTWCPLCITVPGPNPISSFWGRVLLLHVSTGASTGVASGARSRILAVSDVLSSIAFGTFVEQLQNSFGVGIGQEATPLAYLGSTTLHPGGTLAVGFPGLATKGAVVLLRLSPTGHVLPVDTATDVLLPGVSTLPAAAQLGGDLSNTARFGSAGAQLGSALQYASCAGVSRDEGVSVAIGAPADTSARGSVTVVSLAGNGSYAGRLRIDAGVFGANVEVFGTSIAALGDVDGNGVGDMTVVAVDSVAKVAGEQLQWAIHLLHLGCAVTGNSAAMGQVVSHAVFSPVQPNTEPVLGAAGLDLIGASTLSIAPWSLLRPGSRRAISLLAWDAGGGTVPVILHFSSKFVFQGTEPLGSPSTDAVLAAAALGDLDGDGGMEWMSSHSSAALRPLQLMYGLPETAYSPAGAPLPYLGTCPVSLSLLPPYAMPRGLPGMCGVSSTAATSVAVSSNQVTQVRGNTSHIEAMTMMPPASRAALPATTGAPGATLLVAGSDGMLRLLSQDAFMPSQTPVGLFGDSSAAPARDNFVIWALDAATFLPPSLLSSSAPITAMASIGDINADGGADIIVGSVGDSGPAQAGALCSVLLSPHGTVVACSCWSSSASLSTDHEATDLLAVTTGFNTAVRALGAALAVIGDINKDGLPEVFVGAPFSDTPAGTACGIGLIVRLSDSGQPMRPPTYPQAPFTVIAGPDAACSNVRFGTATTAVGDIDGDGAPDMVVLGANTGGDAKLFTVTTTLGSDGTVIATILNSIVMSGLPGGTCSRSVFSLAAVPTVAWNTRPSSPLVFIGQPAECNANNAGIVLAYRFDSDTLQLQLRLKIAEPAVANPGVERSPVGFYSESTVPSFSFGRHVLHIGSSTTVHAGTLSTMLLVAEPGKNESESAPAAVWSVALHEQLVPHAAPCPALLAMLPNAGSIPALHRLCSHLPLWRGGHPFPGPQGAEGSVPEPLLRHGSLATGSAIIHMGDLDGNGAVDFAVSGTGRPGGTTGGDVALVLSSTAPHGVPTVLWLFDDPVFSMQASSFAGDALGHSLITVGDVDGNGATDLLAGAPLRSDRHVHLGAVVLLRMQAGGTALLDTAVTLGDPACFSNVSLGPNEFGSALAVVPGLGISSTADDRSLLVVGAPGTERSGGRYAAGTIVALEISLLGLPSVCPERGGTRGIPSGASTGMGPDLGGGHRFGSSLAVLELGNTALPTYSVLMAVGAPGDDSVGVNAAGAVHLLRVGAGAIVLFAQTVHAWSEGMGNVPAVTGLQLGASLGCIAADAGGVLLVVGTKLEAAAPGALRLPVAYMLQLQSTGTKHAVQVLSPFVPVDDDSSTQALVQQVSAFLAVGPQPSWAIDGDAAGKPPPPYLLRTAPQSGTVSSIALPSTVQPWRIPQCPAALLAGHKASLPVAVARVCPSAPSTGVTAARAHGIIGAGHDALQSYEVAVKALSSSGGPRFGGELAVVGDLDGDGVPELAISSPGEPTQVGIDVNNRGAVRIIFLSADRATVKHFRLISPDAALSGFAAECGGGSPLPAAARPGDFGQVILPIGDVNGDGVDDLWVTDFAQPAGGEQFVGGAYVLHMTADGRYSNATELQSQLLAETEPAENTFMGLAAAMITPPRAPFTYLHSVNYGQSSAIRVYDVTVQPGGAIAMAPPLTITPNLVAALDPAHPSATGDNYTGFGSSQLGVDLDGDGLGELVVGADGSDFACEPAFSDCRHGMVIVLYFQGSGMLGLQAAQMYHQGNSPGIAAAMPANLGVYQQFGRNLAAAGDTNGDGIPDILMSSSLATSSQFSPYRGAVFLLSLTPDPENTILQELLSTDTPDVARRLGPAPINLNRAVHLGVDPMHPGGPNMLGSFGASSDPRDTETRSLRMHRDLQVVSVHSPLLEYTGPMSRCPPGLRGLLPLASLNTWNMCNGRGLATGVASTPVASRLFTGPLLGFIGGLSTNPSLLMFLTGPLPTVTIAVVRKTALEMVTIRTVRVAPAAILGSAFATSVAAVGDMSGDGQADFAVGSIASAPITPSVQSLGRVFIVGLTCESSGDGRAVVVPAGDCALQLHFTLTNSDAEYPGSTYNAHFLGLSVAVVGDLDGDGMLELVVGMNGDYGGLAVIGFDPKQQAAVANPSLFEFHLPMAGDASTRRLAQSPAVLLPPIDDPAAIASIAVLETDIADAQISTIRLFGLHLGGQFGAMLSIQPTQAGPLFAMPPATALLPALPQYYTSDAIVPFAIVAKLEPSGAISVPYASCNVRRKVGAVKCG